MTLIPPPNMIVNVLGMIVIFSLSIICMLIPIVCCCISFISTLRNYKDYELVEQQQQRLQFTKV